MDIQTYVLSRGNTTKQINSVLTGVTEAKVENNTIIFEFSDGSSTEMVFEKPKNGKNGISITDVYMDYTHNHLMIVFSDGHVQDAGEVPPLRSGQSAYEIAVAYGFDGTEAEYLESLKGEQGEQGYSITARVAPITQDNREIGSKITLTSSNPDAIPISPIDLYNGVSPSVTTEPMANGRGNIVTFAYATPGSHSLDDGRTETIYVYNGEKGDNGTVFTMRGQVDTAQELPETGNTSDAFLVGTDDTVVYIWDSIDLIQKNVGPIQGAKGADAVPPTVELIPYDNGEGTTGTTISVTNYVNGEPGEPITRTVYNGVDGINGVDGYSPQCSLTPNVENPNQLDLDVTYKDEHDVVQHLTYALTKGVDGTSAYISVQDTPNGYVFNVRDANTPQGRSYEITNGIDGNDSDIVCTRNVSDDGYDVIITSSTYPDGHLISLMDGSSAVITPVAISNRDTRGQNDPIKTGYRITITDIQGVDTIELWNGIDCTITETPVIEDNEPVGYRIQISDSSGVHEPFVLRHGESAIVKSITRSQSNDATEVEIEDKNGTHYLTIPDGISPGINCIRNQEDNAWVLTITYPDETPRFYTIPDGISPVIQSAKIDDGYRVTITDVNGEQSFILKNGRNGIGISAVLSYVVGDDPFTVDWLSLESDGEPLVPEEGVIYQIKTNDSEYDEKLFTWDDNEQRYNIISSGTGGTNNSSFDLMGYFGYFKDNAFVSLGSDYQNFLPSGIDKNNGTYKIDGDVITYSILATSFHKLRDDWKAFDGQYDTAWGTTQTSNQDIQITLGQAFEPIKIGIQIGFEFANEKYEAPTVYVYASNDDFATSTLIYSKSNLSIGDVIVDNIDTNGVAYNSYKLAVSGATYGVGITEFQLFKESQVGIFEGATDNTDGTRGYVPKPLASENNYFLKGDGTWGELPEFKGANTEFEFYSSRTQQGGYNESWHVISISNNIVGAYYKITITCTSSVTGLNLADFTNAVYIDNSLIVEDGHAEFVVKSTDKSDISIGMTVYYSGFTSSIKSFTDTISIGIPGKYGVIPGAFCPEPEYGSKFLANDGNQYGLDKIVSPFSYTEAVYNEKGSGNLDTMTDGLNSVSITIPNEAMDLVYLKYHTANTSSIVSFSATNANYDTSTIADYGTQDNLHNDYEIILTPTAEQDIVITMSVYSNHTSNSQSYKYGKYTADYYTDGYVVAPKTKPENLEYFGSDGGWHSVDTSNVLSESKAYTDDKLVEAKEYSDTNFETTTEHTDELFENAVNHSDDNLDKAKLYVRQQVHGKSFNSNALITPDYNNILQNRTFLTSNTDTSYTATEECVVFYSLITNSNSVVEINGYNIADSSANDYLFLNVGDVITFNAAEGSYTVFGIRNNNVSGRIYQNTITVTTDENGNVELPISNTVFGAVHVISVQAHLTAVGNTSSVVAIPYLGADGKHYANITDGHAIFSEINVSVTYWYMNDYSATVTGMHTKEVTIHPEDLVNISPLEDYPYKYALSFDYSRDTSYGELAIIKGSYLNPLMLQTTDGYVNILFSSKPKEDITVAVNIYDNVAVKAENIYSTEEQIVGQQIDGKAIYRKTITNLDFQLNQNDKYFAQTPIYALIDNVDTLISATAYSFDNTNRFAMPVTISIENNEDQSIRGVDIQKITALTIEYTKK